MTVLSLAQPAVIGASQLPAAAIDYTGGITNAISSVLAFVPKLVAFLVILLIGYIIAKALSKVVNKILERVGFDSAVERGGIKKALAQSKYDASDIRLITIEGVGVGSRAQGDGGRGAARR